MYKADLLMKFNPEGSKAVNLAQRGDESDEEWPDEDLQRNLCNDDAPNDAMQQILAVFKKFCIRNQSSGKPNANNTRPARVPR